MGLPDHFAARSEYLLQIRHLPADPEITARGEESRVDFCVRHYEEPVEDNCRTCRHGFCARCLVYAFGPKKPPYCVGCALAASGVRSARPQVGAHPAPEPRRPSRAERKAEKAARKAAAKQAKSGAPASVGPYPPAPAAPQPLSGAPLNPPPPPPEPAALAGRSDRELYEQTA